MLGFTVHVDSLKCNTISLQSVRSCLDVHFDIIHTGHNPNWHCNRLHCLIVSIMVTIDGFGGRGSAHSADACRSDSAKSGTPSFAPRPCRLALGILRSSLRQPPWASAHTFVGAHLCRSPDRLHLRRQSDCGRCLVSTGQAIARRPLRSRGPRASPSYAVRRLPPPWSARHCDHHITPLSCPLQTRWCDRS